MKKMKLDLTTLRIDTFQTAEIEGQRGTVQGAATGSGEETCVFCTRQNCGVPSEPGYATYVNGVCIRC